jgi:hypothetical protein
MQVAIIEGRVAMWHPVSTGSADEWKFAHALDDKGGWASAALLSRFQRQCVYA